MTQVNAPYDPADAETGGGVIVRRPRACDAVGKSLRHAFASETAATGDWRRVMRAVDALR